MTTLNNLKLIFLTVVFFTSVCCVYSSDNAAVLYRKAATLYKADKNIEGMLINVINGKTEPNETIKEFIKTNRPAIDAVMQASEIKDCNWELDFSHGMGMIFPQTKCRIEALAELILADAKILAKNGDYRNAICQCIGAYKMALRGNDCIYITYLLGVRINNLTNSCIAQIISDMPPNLEILNELKQQLVAVDKIPFSLKSAILGRREMVLREILIISMKPERLKEYKSFIDVNNLDKAAIGRIRIYCENHFSRIIDAIDKPYLEAIKSLEALNKKEYHEEANNPGAEFIVTFSGPLVELIFTSSTQFKTYNNAVRAAVEIYIINAKTGKLPDVLPDGLPGDLFSDKPFIYEKTADGFTLRCQGKDLDKNEFHEYKCKVKK